MMPPHKSQKPRGPPRTPPELRAIEVGVSFRADQRAALSRLRADRRLSLLCQQAVDLEADMLDLPDSVRDDALEAAAASFFDEWAVAGSYAISQDELIQHKATSGEMALDAETLGIPTGKLIPTLQELFDIEKEYALRKAAVLREYRRKRDDLD